MKYLGLARKYRPKTFEEVVGQQQIATTLQNAIRANRVHHAYLFCGSRGVGKTSMARIFAKALNCVKGPTTVPCNQCELCHRIATGEDVDVIEIDGASNRGIEEIRNIKDNIKYLPSHARFKIFIIDEVHMLTPPAFNALLKTLEEPPEHAKFIFATTQLHSIPDTILSRCQRFHFNQIRIQDIAQQLQKVAQLENIPVKAELFEKIAIRTGGAMRDSLVMLDQLSSYSQGEIDESTLSQIAGDDYEEARNIVVAIAQKNVVCLLDIVQQFVQRGGNISHLMDGLMQQLRDILVVSVTGEGGKFIEGTEPYQQWVDRQKKHFTVEFLNLAIYHLAESKNLLSRNLLGRIILETTLLKILHIDSLLPLKKIEESLYALEDKISKGHSWAPGPVSPRSEPIDMEIEAPAPVTVGMGEKYRSNFNETPPGNHLPPPDREWKKEESRFEGNSPSPVPSPSVAPPSLVSAPDPVSVSAPVPEEEIVPSDGESIDPIPPIESELPVLSERERFPKTTARASQEELWEKFAFAFKNRFPQIGDLLQKQGKGEANEHHLLITLPPEQHFIAGMINAPPKKKVISQLVQEVYGKEIPLKFVFEGKNSPSNLPSEKVENSEKHPLLRRAIELFEGRIVEISKNTT